jgi:amidase
MARSTRDVAVTIEVLLAPGARDRLPQSGYTSFLTQSFVGLKIGFVDPTEWRFPSDLWVPSDEAKEQHVSVLNHVELRRKI